jgi:hypothetical protein
LATVILQLYRFAFIQIDRICGRGLIYLGTRLDVSFLRTVCRSLVG